MLHTVKSTWCRRNLIIHFMYKIWLYANQHERDGLKFAWFRSHLRCVRVCKLLEYWYSLSQPRIDLCKMWVVLLKHQKNDLIYLLDGYHPTLRVWNTARQTLGIALLLITRQRNINAKSVPMSLRHHGCIISCMDPGIRGRVSKLLPTYPRHG